jgi:hypothetical protein
MQQQQQQQQQQSKMYTRGALQVLAGKNTKAIIRSERAALRLYIINDHRN